MRYNKTSLFKTKTWNIVFGLKDCMFFMNHWFNVVEGGHKYREDEFLKEMTECIRLWGELDEI